MKPLDRDKLRLGNFVYDALEKEIVQIDGMQYNFGMQTHDPKYDDHNRHIDAKGIRLNDIWFDAFGFTKMPSGNFHKHIGLKSIMFTKYKRGYIFNWSIGSLEILFVHELQNIYLDLFRRPLKLLKGYELFDFEI